jgi:phage shock protein A
MGIFSKIKKGISSKANAAIDKAISPEKELELAIAELEEGRRKALAELVSYKATAKQLDNEVEKQKKKAEDWEKRAMLALKAGDEDAAREALRQKKAAEVEAVKIEKDKHEAASYAIQLNKSRKEFETKLQMLKLRKGTLATQIAAARSAGGDVFGNDTSVWDKFKAAEDRIDQEAVASEVDAAMRGEDAEAQLFDAKLSAASANAGLLAEPGADDPLFQLKEKMAADKAARHRALGAGDGAKPASTKPVEAKATDARATQATEAKPTEAKATEAKPTEAKATEARPTEAKATEAKPTEAKATEAKPTSSNDAPADAASDATDDAPRPAVKIDESKLEAELAALRASASKGDE